MHHFEGFVCAKDPMNPETSEDQIVVQPGVLYAVIDGATDISGERFDDLLGTNATGGRLASQAMAVALRSYAATPFHALPDAEHVLRLLTEAVGALYDRLGISGVVAQSSDRRFRAAFAAAFISGGMVRLMRVGDCSIRINCTRLLRHDFPADVVLSAARSQAWQILAARGVPADRIRKAVRQLIVVGLDAEDLVGQTGLSKAEIRQIREKVATLPEIAAAVNGDQATLDHILSSGLSGVRAAPERFNALVVDGVSDVSKALAVEDVPVSGIETLELFSDGYPAYPDSVSVRAWEAALRHADETDPERIGTFPSTKGRVGDHFGDDRSIIIARTTMARTTMDRAS